MRDVLRRLSLFGILVAASGAAIPPGLAALAAQAAPLARAKAKKVNGLRILDPVVCKSITGYEDYEKHPDSKMTSDEKLLVYYRPQGYKVVRQGDEYVTRFVQDGQIRRLGEKQVLLRKVKLLNYEAKSEIPPDGIYLRNTFSLKGLPPGEYEYDMILKDVTAKPTIATTTESVKFRVVPAKLPKGDPGTRTEPESKTKSETRAEIESQIDDAIEDGINNAIQNAMDSEEE